jgi:hypothetical protein
MKKYIFLFSLPFIVFLSGCSGEVFEPIALKTTIIKPLPKKFKTVLLPQEVDQEILEINSENHEKKNQYSNLSLYRHTFHELFCCWFEHITQERHEQGDILVVQKVSFLLKNTTMESEKKDRLTLTAKITYSLVTQHKKTATKTITSTISCNIPIHSSLHYRHFIEKKLLHQCFVELYDKIIITMQS